MPEGPECRVVAEGLHAKLAGRQLTGIRTVSGRYTRKDPVGLAKFKASLPVYVTSVRVKGKFIYFILDDDTHIFNTLGMTGGWTEEKTPATRIELEYTSGVLYYNDQRNFGTFKFCMTVDDLSKKLDKDLGIDLMVFHNTEYLDKARKILKLARNKDKTLAEVLMNQKNFPGVGNYVKAEALYRARLSPHRTPASLSDYEAGMLLGAIVAVLTESYSAKRVSLVDYRDMQECGQEFKKVVYKQAKDPVGNPVKAEETKDKRTTYWVPAVQR